MGSQAHFDADEGGCAEVVYTTLPVLVEMIVRCWTGRSVAVLG